MDLRPLRSALLQLQSAIGTVLEAMDGATQPAPGDDGWPLAVPPNRIVPEDDQAVQHYRGEQIADDLEEFCAGAGSILDFGCGAGHLAAALARSGAEVVGYDPAPCGPWSAIPARGNLLLTDNLARVSASAYDRVVLYDVLDHVTADPAAVLGLAVSLLAPGGEMFLRCHPWTSRHGAHQYQVLNRAFVHLYLSEEDLAARGFVPERGWRVSRPLASYEGVINQVGLAVVDRQIQSTEPEGFFGGEVLGRIIRNTWDGKIDEATARKIMAYDFVDYRLRRA